MKTSWLVIGILVCIAVVLGANLIRQQQDAQPLIVPDIVSADAVEIRQPVVSPSLSEALGISEEDMVEVGGVMRPKREVASLDAKIDLDGVRSRYLDARKKVGYAPPFTAADSEAAAQLQKNLSDDSVRPMAISALFKPEPFDRKEYLADKEAYLKLTRPGRVFESLEPGKEVPSISAAGLSYYEVLQGESAILRVNSEPGMPVTFHTPQLGEFSNRLKTITVAASDEGIAEVKYHAVSGARGVVSVLAASPVRSGQLELIVDVKLP